MNHNVFFLCSSLSRTASVFPCLRKGAVCPGSCAYRYLTSLPGFFAMLLCKVLVCSTSFRLLVLHCFRGCCPSGLIMVFVLMHLRRPDGSVGMTLVLPALTDCRWWFESLLVHSGVSSATRRKATGADHKKTSS